MREEIAKILIKWSMPTRQAAILEIVRLIEARDKKLFAEQPNESVAQRTERLRIKRLAETL